MSYSKEIEVSGHPYTIKLLNVPPEADVPHLVEFARQSILQSDNRPVSGVIEVDSGVLVKISAVLES